MGIYDRDYIRDQRTGGPPGSGALGRGGLGSMRFLSVNAWLIIINSGIFILLQPLAANMFGRAPNGMDPLAWYGHFSTSEAFFDFVRDPSGNSQLILNLEVWRFLSFQFLHGGFLHLFFNMFGLWVFGSMVEQYLGSKRYLAFYLVCGVFGGLMYLVLNLLGQTGLQMPGVLPNDTSTPLIGASAGVFGVIVACAYIAPNSVVQLLFPPIPLKLKHFAYGYVAIAAISLITGASNAGGQAAHLGGAIAGFFFIRRSHLLRDFFDVFKDSRKNPVRPPKRRPKADSAEIDRILEKIRTQGIHSISDRERSLLRSATDDKRRRA